jgi:hypothetical protein
MRTPRTTPALRAYLFAVLAGCSQDAGTTLEQLASEGARMQSLLERDACSCSCGQLICWNFTCSGDGCSSADEYELVVEREPGSGDGECFEPTRELTGRLFVDGGDPVVADSVSQRCHEISFLWRGPREGIDTRAHHVELADSSATWSLVNPFARSSLAIVAPASAVATSPNERGTLHAGEVLVIGISPPVELTEVHAALQSGSTHASLELSTGDVREDALELIVPADTPIGVYDLKLHTGTLLSPEACDGPSVCGGLGLEASLPLRID